MSRESEQSIVTGKLAVAATRSNNSNSKRKVRERGDGAARTTATATTSSSSSSTARHANNNEVAAAASAQRRDEVRDRATALVRLRGTQEETAASGSNACDSPSDNNANGLAKRRSSADLTYADHHQPTLKTELITSEEDEITCNDDYPSIVRAARRPCSSLSSLSSAERHYAAATPSPITCHEQDSTCSNKKYTCAVKPEEAAAAGESSSNSTPSTDGNNSNQQSSSSPIEALKIALRGYDHNRIYLAYVSLLDWRDLPGKRSSSNNRDDKVWIVGAADQEGRHRTRLLVTGRHWRPKCLRRVNMLSQPVVYAGGGRGSLTAELFHWWFHHEFAVSAIAMHPDGAILIAERADYLPPEVKCVAADGLVRLFIIPKDCLEPRIVTKEMRIRLAVSFLSTIHCQSIYSSGGGKPLGGSNNDCSLLLDECLRRFTLKEAFVDLHRAWLGVRSKSFARSLMLPGEREDMQNSHKNSRWLSGRVCHASDHDEDSMLLGELETLARDAGLDVNDEEIAKWMMAADESAEGIDVKTELMGEWEEIIDGEQESEPSAEEAAKLLSRVLLWMESEPLDPGVLLAARSMRNTAALMVSVT